MRNNRRKMMLNRLRRLEKRHGEVVERSFQEVIPFKRNALRFLSAELAVRYYYLNGHLNLGWKWWKRSQWDAAQGAR
jgi:hypothetical protein